MLFSLAVVNYISKVDGLPQKWTVFDHTRRSKRLKMDGLVLNLEVQITFSERPQKVEGHEMKTGRSKGKTRRSFRMKLNENLERSKTIQTVKLKWPSTFR